jgi:hypothetical protein
VSADQGSYSHTQAAVARAEFEDLQADPPGRSTYLRTPSSPGGPSGAQPAIRPRARRLHAGEPRQGLKPREPCDLRTYTYKSLVDLGSGKTKGSDVRHTSAAPEGRRRRGAAAKERCRPEGGQHEDRKRL